MDIQQEINISLLSYFEEQGISFAYPTQTVMIAKD
jgi:small-conductance mechanosensitive channel